MALSVIVYPGDGVRTQFNIPFALGYIKESDVTARVDGEVDGAGNQLYRTLVFLSPEIVEVQGAPVPVGTNIIFERTVVQDELIVDYEDGDVINEDNLNTSQKQMIMLVHQVLDGRFAQFQSSFDMGGFRITGVGDPVDAQDVATKNYVDVRISTGQASANAAAASAAAALASQNAAASSASAAAGSATASLNSATVSTNARDVAVSARDAAVAAQGIAQAARNEALTFRNAAETFKNSAEAAANSAGNSSTSANTNAIAAATSATTAAAERVDAQTARTGSEAARDASQTAQLRSYNWAQAAENVIVDDTVRTGYSAYHWSAKAAASAAAAATFDPANYVAKAGDTMTGDLTLRTTSAFSRQLKWVLSNGVNVWSAYGGDSGDNTFRLLRSDGASGLAVNQAGQVYALGYGWMHDRFASKGSDCNHGGGIFEIGLVATGGNGTVDCPNPYVMAGLRTIAGNNSIYVRVTHLDAP
ncbi:tail fiber protein [Agrobacterium phage Alfirin]|nr:tail fiber protein [Agrobacterium phage Alfirin]